MTSLVTSPWSLLILLAVAVAVGRVVQRTAWSRQQLLVTRGAAVVAVWVVSVLIGGAIVTGQVAVSQLRQDRESVARRFDTRIKKEARARKRLASTINRVTRLERPDDRELATRLLRSLRLVNRDPDLQRELADALPQAPGGAAPPVATPTPTATPAPDRTPPRERQPPRRPDPEPSPAPTPAGGPEPPRLPLPQLPGVDIDVCTPLLQLGDDC